MVPRIFPCVPLPEPGAPTSSMVRYFISSSLAVFVANLHGLNLDKGNHDLGGGISALELNVHFIHRNTADPFSDVFAAHRLDHHDQVLVGLARNHPKEAGKFCFEKPAVEREL